jgi:hypothetical protein
MKTIYLIAVLVAVSACMPAKNMYYWGDYEKSYYNKVKNPGDAANEEHMEVLAKIIEKTEKSTTKRIGPGIFAEYGYNLLLTGKSEEAAAYFAKEQKAFPESDVIVKFIAK